MSEISAVEVAKKQRHYFLLNKVKENKTALTSAELEELEKYEMAGKPKKENISNKKPPRRLSWSLTQADCQRLGYEYENIVAADAAAAVKPNLSNYLEKHPHLKIAWQRGQFLRNLQALAGIVATVSEAAHKLGLVNGEALRDILDTDKEAADIWSQTRLNTIIEARAALLTAAKEGNQTAIKAVENYLREEKSSNTQQVDLVRLRQVDICNLFATTRPSLNEWENKYRMPRNVDKTYSLKDVLAWYIEYMKVKTDTGSSRLSTDKLRDLKAKQMELDLSEREGGLLDRNEVIAGFTVRWQNIVNSFNTKKREIAIMLHGQTIDGIEDILSRFFGDIQNEQLNVPEFLKLSKEAEEKLIECMELCKKNI